MIWGGESPPYAFPFIAAAGIFIGCFLKGGA
jgi:hypothetical protein